MRIACQALLLATLVTMVDPHPANAVNVHQEVAGEKNVAIGVVNGNVVIYNSPTRDTKLNTDDGSVRIARKRTVYLNSQVSISAGSITGEKVWLTVKVTGRPSISRSLTPTKRLAFRYRSEEPNYAVELVNVSPEDGVATIRVVPI